MAPYSQVMVLEQCRIPPSPPSPPPTTTTLPLTYFDLLFYRFHPVQRLFLYHLPCSTTTFLATHLPNLKRSLSLALRLFRPLAGRLLPGYVPTLSSSSNDSVLLTVTACDDDFHELTGNHPKDTTRFHSLVPDFPVSGTKQPVLALQVTMFPDHGIGIGMCIHHGVADGSTSTHFMKTWASICRLGDVDAAVEEIRELPFYDRSVIPDPKGLEMKFLSQLEELKDDKRLQAWDLRQRGGGDVVRATFVLTRSQLDRLVQYVFAETSTKCSPFSVACAVAWVCLVKAKPYSLSRPLTCGLKTERFGFVTGCRARLNPPTPTSYFGNCLGICKAEVRRAELAGGSGMVKATVAIWDVIRGLERGGAFDGAENWVSDMLESAAKGALTVAGSPKLGVYKVDFGWGRPRKVEVVSMERTSAISLAENGDEEEGGLEIGVALARNGMDEFISLFNTTVKSHS